MDKTLLSAEDMTRTLERLAFQVWEKHGNEGKNLILIGIQRRGVDLARRLSGILETRLGSRPPLGTLDINLYRDDWTTLTNIPALASSSIPGNIDGKNILLVDDVLYTGRTVRAALEAILDYGRPRCIELMVLMDRGRRELPLHADYVGKSINTAATEQVNVLLAERDGKDEVVLRTK